MAAMVQTLPQQTSTATMLQARPSSASGMMSGTQGNAGPQYGGSQQHRNSFYGNPGGPSVYRSGPAPIQPYAFTATPNLNTMPQWQQYGNFRTSSSPTVPTMQSLDYNSNSMPRSRYPASASMTNLPTMGSLGYGAPGARDDSAISATGRRTSAQRPHSVVLPGATAQAPMMQLSGPAKAAPDRYRRPAARANDPSLTSRQSLPQLHDPAFTGRPNSSHASTPTSGFEEIQLYRGTEQDSRRVRRLSMPALDSADYPKPLTPPIIRRAEDPSRPMSADKEHKSTRVAGTNGTSEKMVHSRTGSSESVVSSRSSHSRPSSATNRNANLSISTSNPALSSSVPDQNGSNQDHPKLVNIPPRGSSSADVGKRVVHPSPLSRPMTMDADLDVAGTTANEAAASKSKVSPSPSQASHVDSPAVKQLAAINQKGTKLKSKTSRLRRAFSFGSAAEFRKVTGTEEEETPASSANSPAKLHKQPTAEELYENEQARIAQAQEEAGIGNSIYAGAKIFAGSTDNLSISSTASSASIMIRKMGRGMKKGGRSLVGLFRPKSVIGIPAADAHSPEPGQAEVSMITVEAERERVNVNADLHVQSGGGTGFPRLERNSIDASKAPSTVSERLGSSGTDTSAARKSIVGGEKERAEVLAAVRKGILKKTDGSGSSTPTRGPTDTKNPAFELPQVPHISDSPMSSAPSTPNDDIQGHKRTGSISIGSEDYFMSALRLRQDTKSAPTTPQGTLKRNATFSPRLVFYDTWPSQEYDRRGEVATCNRLTPMLAQQIKEELNTFKMEMEVHENSKIYTHFF